MFCGWNISTRCGRLVAQTRTSLSSKNIGTKFPAATVSRTSQRYLSEKAVNTTTTTSSSKAPQNILIEPAAKPPSRIRAVFFGFLGGLSAGLGVSHFLLTDDIVNSNVSLQNNVTALRQDATKINSSVAKIEVLEAEFAKLKKSTASAATVEQVKADVDRDLAAMKTELAKHQASMWESQETIYKQLANLEGKIG